MKILVTGAAGFIGSYLSRALIARGDDVIGIDNFYEYYPKKCKEFNLDLIDLFSGKGVSRFEEGEVAKILAMVKPEDAAKKGTFSFFEGDIRDFDFLKKLFADNNFDCIMHLAAMAGVQYSIKDPKLYSEVNIEGTVNLLELSRTTNLKNFVLASSASVYGNSNNVPFKETFNVTSPVSPYAATKVADEVIAFSHHHNFKLPVTCLRFFSVYGPLQRPYGMVIQRYINQTYHNVPVSMYGDGTMSRDHTYIDDIISGVLSAIDKPSEFEIVNLGNSKPVTLNELVAHIGNAFEKELKINYMDRPSTEVDITYADVSKANKLYGYDPKTSIAEGVKKQVEVFLAMPQWYKDLEV